MTDPSTLQSFVEDAAHYPGGHAAGVVFPRSEADVAAVLRQHRAVLAIGAQSSVTGGATPRGEVVLSTVEDGGDPRDLRDDFARVQPGLPIVTLKEALAAQGRYYPPAPTYDGAFVGGTIATNASGAATFKYGSTRNWVRALSVVLASGEVLDIVRGEVRAHARRLLRDRDVDRRRPCAGAELRDARRAEAIRRLPRRAGHGPHRPLHRLGGHPRRHRRGHARHRHACAGDVPGAGAVRERSQGARCCRRPARSVEADVARARLSRAGCLRHRDVR